MNRRFLNYTKAKKKIKNIASSGNRTRAARVAGEHSTTEPTMLTCCQLDNIRLNLEMQLKISV